MQSVSSEILLRGLGNIQGNPEISAVVTDSRKAAAGSLFVCIKGEHADGHDFAVQALQQGAEGIVAEHPVEGIPAEKCIVVPDVLDALIRIGGNYRDCFSPVLIGVTGSVGKTTTKEFCAAVFSEFGRTIKTEGNQNNEIGMPNTLFRLDRETEYAVVEMGMQGLGEIEKLTLAAKPSAAIITCIGSSHLQQLGSRQNILKAKLEICDGLPEGAPIILNADDDFLPKAKIRPDLKKVFFSIGHPEADVRARKLSAGVEGTHFIIEDKLYGGFPAFIPALGMHNVRNALSAYAAATRLGMNPEKAAAALSDYKTTGYRQHIVEYNGITVIEDCYNANPDSMRAALHTLYDYPVEGRRVAVLGDMLELGEATEQAHAESGTLAAHCRVDLLLTVGNAMAAAHRQAKDLGVPATHCANREDAVSILRYFCRPGDAVLVKASHGMEFDKILAGFYGKKDEHTAD